MTQKVNDNVKYAQLLFTTVLLGLSSWTLITVNGLQIKAAEHSVQIDNIEKSIIDLKEVKIMPSGRADVTMQPSTTYVHSNKVK